MVAMNLNTGTYVIAISATSASAALTTVDANQSSLIMSNESTKSVFVFSSPTPSLTAVFPASATVPVNGKVILPGAIVTFTKNVGDTYVYAVQAIAGTGNLYISAGPGE